MTRSERPRSVCLVALSGLLAAAAACGGGSGGGNEPDSRAPSGLSYASNPVEYVRGIEITPNNASVSGDPVISFQLDSSSPQLPAGLQLNAGNGAITGTPTVAATQATYTVIASNAYGSTSVGLKLSVREPTGYVISGTVSGEQPQLGRIKVFRTSDNSLLKQVDADQSGNWAVEGATNASYRVEVSASALASSYKFYPTSQPVTVSSGNVEGVDFCIAKVADQATICKVTLSSYSPKIGGDPISYSIDLVNWTSSALKVGLAIYIEGDLNQNPVFSLPVGPYTRTGSLSVPAYWSQYPGPHDLSINLNGSGSVPLSSVLTPITLVP